MDQKPLSYDALRNVLGHMEANKRIQISIACPSLRNVEKSIPLKIHHLSFLADYLVQINNNVYNFGLIRQYREGTPPEDIQAANNRGGLCCDVDEWGFEKPSYRLTLTPGDISFLEIEEENDEDDEGSEDVRYYLERRIEANQEGRGRPDDRLMYTEYKLLPYLCRENNVKPAHDCFVQLNLRRCDFQLTSRPVQKVPYAKRLHEAMKGFMKFIFVERSYPMEVNCLEIDSTTQIVRLPVGVKFSVHELRVSHRISFFSKFLLPILDESCLPIQHINQESQVNLNDPFIANAEEITFHDGFYVNLFEFIRSLPHLKVNFFSQLNNFYNEKFIEFIKNLLESDEKVGTTYQLGYSVDQNISENILAIENDFMKSVAIGNGNWIIRNKGSIEAHITYRQCVKHMYFGTISRYCVLKIQILRSRQETND